LEIQELKRDLEIFFTDSENGYGLYSTERLLILAQQGDEKAKLQILFNFKGLIYKTLVNNSYYLQLSAGDILQNLSEVVLQRMAVWKPKAAAAFGHHIKYCLRATGWREITAAFLSEIRRIKKHDYKELSYDAEADGGISQAEQQLDTLIYRRFGYNEKQATLRFAVKDLLDGLTEKQRYVLQAELFEGKDGTEIARLLHIKKAAVSRIRARALRHLQELLAAGRQRGERLC